MRFIVVILALALYGAYSLFSGLFGEKPEASKTAASLVAKATTASPEMSLFSLDGAQDLAMKAASAAAGVELKPLPLSGCSESVLSPTKVLELVNSLEEPQKTALAKALDMSSSVWTAQLYKDESGTGLCLPQQGKMVRLPIGVNLDFLNSQEN